MCQPNEPQGDDPLYGHGPEHGLHVLKDVWGQKAYLQQQSVALATGLPGAIQVTYNAAHVRTPEQGFLLDRQIPQVNAIAENLEERRLEAAVLQRWNNAEMSPVPRCWSRLVAYQVPLYAQQQQDGWGKIDLLGVTRAGLPVVVELKRSPAVKQNGMTDSSESPLRMLLEASAYAVALRKNWNDKDGDFRAQWVRRLGEIGFPQETAESLPEQLTTVHLVAAAPVAFWMDWLPVTAKGRTVSAEAWRSFGYLVKAFESADLPTSFVSITGHAEDVDSLGVQPFVGFPPC